MGVSAVAERLFPVVYLEVNAVALLILLIVFFGQQRTGIGSPDQRLFRRLVVACGLMLVLDTGMWLLDARTFPGARVALYLVTAAYYIFTPLTAYAWVRYCDYRVHTDMQRLRRRRALYWAPFALNAAVCASSVWTGGVFYVDESNVYHRGPLFVVHGVLTLLYFLYALVLLWRPHAQKNMSRSERIYMTLFMLPPAVGVAIQWAVYGISVLWVMAAVSVLFIYINVQNQQIFSDPLTGLNNRRRLEQFTEIRLRQPLSGERLFALMIDLDHFKAINDAYGHAAGDRALIDMADALKKVCAQHNDFLARIGGDEFLLLCQRKDEAGVKQTVNELRSYVDELNQTSAEPYKLAFSAGWAEFDGDGTINADAVIAQADRRMYRFKGERGRKQQR